MKIQVNSDKTVTVDVRMIRFVEGEVSRTLDRFGAKLTRVEVHLSDVDNKKTGQADKRCLIEARPAGARPLSASATATKVASAVSAALGKMQRSLTTFFGRHGRVAVDISAPSTAKKVVKKTVAKKAAAKKTVVKKPAKKAAAKTPVKLSAGGPPKKRIYQARRKSWPAR